MWGYREGRASGTFFSLFTFLFAMLLGGFLEFGALLFGEHLVDAYLGGVHLARDFGLKLSLAVEEWIQIFGLIALSFHIDDYAVAYGLLTGTEFVDALARLLGDGFKFAFLVVGEVADNLGDVGTLTLTTVVGRFLSRYSESKKKCQGEEKKFFHCFFVLIVHFIVRVFFVKVVDGVLGSRFDRRVVIVVGNGDHHRSNLLFVVGGGGSGTDVDNNKAHDSGGGSEGCPWYPTDSADNGLGGRLQIGVLAHFSHDTVHHVDLFGAGLLRELFQLFVDIHFLLVLYLFGEVFLGAEDERFHLGKGALHDFSNLVVGEILEGVEYEGCALFVLEVSNGGAEGFHLLVVDDLLLGVAVGGHLFWRVLPFVAADKALPFVQHLADDIDCDAVDVRTQLRVETEAGKGHVELNEDLLCHFFHLESGAAEFVGEVGHNLLVAPHDERVLLGVSCEDSLDDFLVFHCLESLLGTT